MISWLISIFIITVATVAYTFKKIDLGGAIAGIILALIIWFGVGSQGLLALAVFFVLGTFATSWGKSKKIHYKLAQENDGKRGIVHVMANGSPALILSIFALIFPSYQNQLGLMVMAGFATACSDTLSSELGTVYGEKYISIISFKPAKRGADGAISIQGILFGIFGSAAIGSISWIAGQNIRVFVLITVCGIFGNLMDSVLGASWQKRGWLNNHTVNLLSICISLLMCILVSHIM